VTGPAGIGKTTLTEVFAKAAHREGALVVAGRCRDRDGVPAFWLWTQVLRRLTQEEGLREALGEFAGAQEPADLVAGLSQTSRGSKRGDQVAAEQQQFRYFDAATRALQACARQRPILLVLEDLQWAGGPSLRLFEHLACELDDAPLLVLATVRDEPRERAHRVDRTTSVVRQQDRCTHVALGGLSRAEVGALLARAIGRPAPADLTSELYARTEGVPFFLGEAIRLLAERGDLAHPERIPRGGVGLPDRAVDLIRRSLDGLSPACADLVGAGAVLGRDFSLAQLASVADVERGEALDLIDEAIRVGVVEEAEDEVARYRFTHALFQEAVYESLPTGARARLHQRAATQLERKHADSLESVIAELAHHHHRGIAVGDPERAFEVATQAAEIATQLFAWEQAARHYEQAADALGHCEAVDPERRLATLLALGEAHRLSGDRTRRREVFQQAMEVARSLGAAREFARAAIGFCEITEWSPHDLVAQACIEEALSVIADDDAIERARLTTRLGYLMVERPHDAEPFGREGVRLARACGDSEALSEALYILHYIIAGPDNMDERADCIGEIERAAHQSRGRDTAVIALLDIACDAITLGDMPGTRRLRERTARLAGQHPSPNMKWHQTVWDAGLALLEGRFDEVEQLAHDALLIGQRIQHPYARACFNSQLVLVQRERGDYETLISLLGPALSARRGATHWAKALVGRAELTLGNEAAARDAFEELARDDFETIPRSIRWSGTMPEVAMLCAELEDAPRARQLMEILRGTEHHHGVLPVPINYSGPFKWTMGRLSALLGLVDDATVLYEEALHAAEDMGARPICAHIRCDLAGLLARTGKVERARGLLEESANVAGELGMSGLSDRVDRVLRRASR